MKYEINNSVIDILKKLITYKTITPHECGIFTYIRSLLPDFQAIEIERNGVKNLFLYQHFEGKSGAKHCTLAGHIDVVPAGKGWESDPFSPILKDGYLYGRGAQDMKGGVAAMISALQKFSQLWGAKQKCSDSHKSHKNCTDSLDSEESCPFRTLSLLLTSDEEGSAKDGTLAMLEHLKEINFLPDMAIVAEPTSQAHFGDVIKIGRRGSINGKLTVKGKQGHVAYPGKCINPVELIAPKIPYIAGFDLDDGDEFFLPSKMVITDIRGGIEAVNVTPDELKIMFNIRNSTKTNIDKVRQHISDVLVEIPHVLELEQSSQPFLTNQNSEILQRVNSAIEQVRGNLPRLETGGGTSDARYFAAFGIDVVECGVVNDRIHAANERVKISEIMELEAVLLRALVNRTRAFGAEVKLNS